MHPNEELVVVFLTICVLDARIVLATFAQSFPLTGALLSLHMYIDMFP